MAALQNSFWDPIKMPLPDTMAVSVTSCKSVHRILCTEIPVLSTSCKPIPVRPRFAAEFTQESDRRNVHRSGDNDLVWVGRAANYAAKLSALNDGFATYITDSVYDSLHDSVKYALGSHANMWEARTWTAINNMSIYASNHHWTVI